MKKRILSLFLVLTLAFAFVGCNTTKTQAPTVDREGNSFTIDGKIETIVSLAPSTTEVLIDLGESEKIVAIDNNSTSINGLKENLTVFDIMNPDIEKLVSVNPDIIFVSNISTFGADEGFKKIKDMGIPVVVIPTSESIEEIKKDITFIAQVVGQDKKGKEIVDTMTSEIEKIASIGKTITEQKTVYFEIASAPYIYSFGSDVFLNELIETIGAKNVFKDQKGWMPVEVETAVSANADVIMTNVNYIEDAVGEIKSRNGWENMTAVKNSDVYYIDNFASSLPNHNIVKALKEMAKAVYPDKY